MKPRAVPPDPGFHERGRLHGGPGLAHHLLRATGVTICNYRMNWQVEQPTSRLRLRPMITWNRLAHIVLETRATHRRGDLVALAPTESGHAMYRLIALCTHGLISPQVN